MNLFKFLKQKSGKVVFGTTQALVTSAAVGLFASYAAFTGGQIAAEKESVRDLSAIGREDTVSSSGFRRSKSGMLTSINLKDGLNQVATAEERAALEGNGPANDFGLDNVDSINNLSFGSASQGGSTDGLGTGGVAATEMPARAAVSSPYGGASGSGLAITPTASSPSSAPTARLGTASMARASGNNLNASGPTGGSSSSTRAGGSSSSGAGKASAPSYTFSGSMPSASSASAAMRTGNAAAGSGSNFTRGSRTASSRNGGRYSPSMGNELRDISKKSAEVAGNKNRGTNDGSDPFMASSTRSGGMTVSGEGPLSEGVASSDFDNKQEVKLRGIQKWTAQKKDDEAERSKARRNLTIALLAALAATLIAIPTGFHFLSLGKKCSLMAQADPDPIKKAVWSKMALKNYLIGAGIMAVATGGLVTVIAMAGVYAHKYSGGTLPTLAGILGGVGLAAIAATTIAALQAGLDGGSKYYEGFYSAIIGPLQKNGLRLLGSSVKQVAISKAVGAVQQGLSGKG